MCRAANILNRTYFSDDVITVMAQNIAARVRHGGLLVVCRTINETAGRSMNLATVLRKNHASLEVIGRLNGGCDVENLVSIPLRH